MQQSNKTDICYMCSGCHPASYGIRYFMEWGSDLNNCATCTQRLDSLNAGQVGHIETVLPLVVGVGITLVVLLRVVRS